MFRETDDFAVDLSGDNLLIVQKGPGEAKPGQVQIDPRHIFLLGEWLKETREEQSRRKKSAK